MFLGIELGHRKILGDSLFEKLTNFPKVAEMPCILLSRDFGFCSLCLLTSIPNAAVVIVSIMAPHDPLDLSFLSDS